jgi:hypothetical protein
VLVACAYAKECLDFFFLGSDMLSLICAVSPYELRHAFAHMAKKKGKKRTCVPRGPPKSLSALVQSSHSAQLKLY